jgi:hypothetical protein
VLLETKPCLVALDGEVGMCIHAHMNPKTIRARLEHSSIRATGDPYAHLLQAVKKRDLAASTTWQSLRRGLPRKPM